ncbi:AMP-binding protein [Antarcticimicrobium luteum]|uniref:Long-chain-fatty-acid--CoA ligase n=1 Tax=Antarcticimicrobium luteum TaxID=2547397 RepID=A0A4R5UYR2_9RHOB|nr:AMP-binding protein [Antarcticimicrobium luteum]TDK44502.1 dicarboxylate--CoA ligase PimA [Antarcticimicrobium luteum]
MTVLPKPGTRPWHAFYNPGVRPDYVPPDTTLTGMMAEAFAAHGPRVLIEYPGEEITYAEMQALAARGAAALRAFGLNPGDRLALHLPNCPWHPVFFFAAMTAGLVVTHLSPLDAPEEIAHKLADSDAKLVVSLARPEFSAPLMRAASHGKIPPVVQCPDGAEDAVSDGAIPVAAFWAGQEGADWAPVAVDPQDIALLQYTGGTTGRPKAAVLTHANIAASVNIYREYLTGEVVRQPGKHTLLYAPVFHILGLSTQLLRGFADGLTLHLRPRFDAARALDDIETHGINILSGVPTMWIAILRQPGVEKRDLSSLEFIGSGGAPLPVEVYQRVCQLTGLKLRGGWGMTETSPAGSNVPAGLPDDKLGTIGIPLPGLEIKIVDTADPGRELPYGEDGEMAIRGPNVTSAYWNRPEETAAAFHDGWFLTGDIGHMDADGFLYLVDRKKDMILSGGFNVYPVMIEDAVHRYPGVSEAMAIGVPDEYRGESAKVFVVLNPGAETFTLEALQAFLADKLGRHEIPRALEFREALPKTSVGKLDRKALRAEVRAEVEVA